MVFKVFTTVSRKLRVKRTTVLQTHLGDRVCFDPSTFYYIEVEVADPVTVY